MINCLLTVAQCTLITNHSAAENGIFQRNDLHQSSTILLMEEKRIPKKLEEAKDNCGIPSGGAGGCQGQGRAQELAGLSWRGRSCPGAQPWDSSEALLPPGLLWGGKPNPVLWRLTWLGVKHRINCDTFTFFTLTYGFLRVQHCIRC